jgi:YegS/Rv2252/BmrU family lipid kinase
MKKICIICNAKISFLKKYKLNKIYKILSKENNVEIFKTEKAGHGTVLCKVNINKFDIIVAAGGDGTINEVVNGMNDKKPLAIIPFGTANILALEAGIHGSAEEIARIILSNKTKKVYVPNVNNKNFILMASAGYDAEIVEAVQSSLTLKNIFKKLLFFIVSSLKLIVFKKNELKILANNKIYKANWIIVTNAMHYGGAFKLSKDTNIFDKKIIAYLFCNLTRLNFLCYFFTLLLNKELKESNKLIKIKSDDIFISSKTKTPVQYDGEFLGYLPAQIKSTKKTINLLVKEELNVQTDQ